MKWSSLPFTRSYQPFHIFTTHYWCQLKGEIMQREKEMEGKKEEKK